MLHFIEITSETRPRQRRIINAILTLATGVLALIYPDLLYLIAGGYLVALGILFLSFKLPSLVAAIPLVTGILIFIFPELIPVTLGIFLGVFGLILFFSFSLSVLGVITFAIGMGIYFNPDSVAYFIAAFMLLYSVNTLMQLRKD
jgi:membrane-associated HD superfamily phosphohydrolase